MCTFILSMSGCSNINIKTSKDSNLWPNSEKPSITKEIISMTKYFSLNSRDKISTGEKNVQKNYLKNHTVKDEVTGNPNYDIPVVKHECDMHDLRKSTDSIVHLYTFNFEVTQKNNSDGYAIYHNYTDSVIGNYNADHPITIIKNNVHGTVVPYELTPEVKFAGTDQWIPYNAKNIMDSFNTTAPVKAQSAADIVNKIRL